MYIYICMYILYIYIYYIYKYYIYGFILLGRMGGEPPPRAKNLLIPPYLEKFSPGRLKKKQ